MSSMLQEDRFVGGQSGTFDGVLEDVGHGIEPKGGADGERGQV